MIAHDGGRAVGFGKSSKMGKNTIVYWATLYGSLLLQIIVRSGITSNTTPTIGSNENH